MQISGPDGIEKEPRRMHFDKGKEARGKKTYREDDQKE
jgi:hypothetical protein